MPSRSTFVLLLLMMVAIAACDNGQPPPKQTIDSVGSAVESPTSDTLPDTAPSANIRVYRPRPEAVIDGTTLAVDGLARTFENGVNYRVLDQDSAVLVEGHTTAQGGVGRFNPFAATVHIPAAYRGTATLEVFQYSARDGSMTDVVRVPLTLEGDSTAVSHLTVFFTNPDSSGTSTDCGLVYPVSRSVDRTVAVAKAALEALLAGPSERETSAGYATQLPSELRLLDISISNRTARADFSDDLDRLAGSCRVTAARAQIERTLRQFSTVDSVLIAVNGRSQGVLQP